MTNEAPPKIGKPVWRKEYKIWKIRCPVFPNSKRKLWEKAMKEKKKSPANWATLSQTQRCRPKNSKSGINLGTKRKKGSSVVQLQKVPHAARAPTLGTSERNRTAVTTQRDDPKEIRMERRKPPLNRRSTCPVPSKRLQTMTRIQTVTRWKPGRRC